MRQEDHAVPRARRVSARGSGDLAELTLRDVEGNAYTLAGQKRVFLCRCGASTTKPFCDGQHSKIGFQAAEAAVEPGA